MVGLGGKRIPLTTRDLDQTYVCVCVCAEQDVCMHTETSLPTHIQTHTCIHTFNSAQHFFVRYLCVCVRVCMYVWCPCNDHLVAFHRHLPDHTASALMTKEHLDRHMPDLCTVADGAAVLDVFVVGTVVVLTMMSDKVVDTRKHNCSTRTVASSQAGLSEENTKGYFVCVCGCECLCGCSAKTALCCSAIMFNHSVSFLCMQVVEAWHSLNKQKKTLFWEMKAHNPLIAASESYADTAFLKYILPKGLVRN